eukprot:178969-Amphidinium_carterae.1
MEGVTIWLSLGKSSVLVYAWGKHEISTNSFHIYGQLPNHGFYGSLIFGHCSPRSIFDDQKISAIESLTITDQDMYGLTR